MSRTYVHLSGRDIDKAINKIYGLEEEEDEKERTIQPQKCPRCGYINAPTDRYCGRCALILDEKERL
ncbi:MAG TPA: integrase, partial [Archaeoglobaceae archaeon]|nr:integrase [Archaeoglobaceae archaeon]